MKFVDSAKITVIAGNGGNGCISFQKKGRNNLLKKPDGSNGGDGGNVWLLSDINMNTLNYFCYNRIFRAVHGEKGHSKNCTGKKGKDIFIKVPLGTKVYVQKTYKLLGDMIDYCNTPLIVAKGGRHGLGNNHFKYSFLNRQYKKALFYKTYGMLGECQDLLLELMLIADVGLFGLPNSGKSSFISMISNAKPKIANYPFTTLTPNLGTVQINDSYGTNRFVVADIPGIIKGASYGLGLGIRFLKHLERCSMLLHFVDIGSIDSSNPVENIASVERELNNYNTTLIRKTRWLVFNKIDLLSQFKLENKIDHIIRSLQWKDRYYSISAIKGINVLSLCYDIMQFINHNKSIVSNI